MHNTDFVYVDIRWCEKGWLEAMRLRLTGWLPDHLVARGLAKGVVQKVQKDGGMHVALTARGIALTEPGTHSLTSENCQQLAQALLLRNYRDDWLKNPRDDVLQFSVPPLDASYRNSLLAFLHELS